MDQYARNCNIEMSPILSFIVLVVFLPFYQIECKSLGDSVSTDLRFIRTCNHTSPISMNTMNDVLISKKLHHGESNAFKCFLHCLFKQYGWMDSDGGFLLHDIKRTLEESEVDVSSLEHILYKCTSMDSTNRCERSFQFTQCFWEKMEEQQPYEDQLFYNIEDRK